ncbi:MFS transporter [Paenibacillus sp. NPDC056579]|uniref:MFS transporter n=1 Tax=Paenibacillus sp. NPDC056579 TaxID=3345871 RepID=UPI003695E54A
MDRAISDNWKKKISLFLIAQTVSLFGSSLVQYAIIWYITLSTSSGAMMTISTLCGFLPQIAISLFAGVWIDRFDRKKMMMLADGTIAFVTLILAILFLSGYTSIWLLFTALLIRSAGTGVQTPAVNALIPQLVPKDKLMRINGIYSSITSLTMFLSPAASAAILSIFSIETTFFIDVFTAVIGISLMFAIQVPAYLKSKPQSQLQGIREGFGYLRENAYIQRLLVFLVIVMILISPAAFLTPLMVSRSFGPEMWRLSVNEMSYSAGLAIGGILVALWGGFRNRMSTTTLACALYGLLMIGLGVAPLFSLYLLLNFLIGITGPYFNTPITVSLQEKVEPSMHGRVFSLIQIANSCSLPLGMVFFGPLADRVAIESLLMYSGVLLLICASYSFFHKQLKSMN